MLVLTDDVAQTIFGAPPAASEVIADAGLFVRDAGALGGGALVAVEHAWVAPTACG
jgi:hypothetical protein